MTTHIAGTDLTLDGRYRRQRCAWCGAVLADYDLSLVAVPEGQDPSPAMWEPGHLVRVEGNWSADVGDDTAKIPGDSCAMLDPAVTA